MEQIQDLKSVVKEKYKTIALQQAQGCCCGCGCEPTDEIYNIMSDDYSNVEGHAESADLGLGCGIPTEFAGIEKGHTVLDLGSGAGNDAFIASKIVGRGGKVYGLDMTEEMIAKANKNKEMLLADNTQFLLGDIEDIPLENSVVDVVISNCVLNLVPDKNKAFSEIHRVLKSKGRFCVSDVVLNGTLPEKVKNTAELYAGCVSGASQTDDYLKIISDLGFKNIIVHKKKEISLPEELLTRFLNEQEIDEFRNMGSGIYSITVSAEK